MPVSKTVNAAASLDGVHMVSTERENFPAVLATAQTIGKTRPIREFSADPF